LYFSSTPLVTLSAAKGLDSVLKRFFAALRMTESTGQDSLFSIRLLFAAKKTRKL
jgi:hypothetical protein